MPFRPAARVDDSLPDAQPVTLGARAGTSSREPATSSNGPETGPAEVLLIGPTGPARGAHNWMPLALLLALALMFGGAAVGWRWWRAAPTFSTDEIVSAYRRPVDQPGSPTGSWRDFSRSTATAPDHG